MRRRKFVLVWKPEGMSHLEDLDVEGRVILNWILRKYVGMTWT